MQTERIQTAIRLNADLYNRIRRRAHIEKRSINSYIEKVLDDHTNGILSRHSDGSIDFISPSDFLGRKE